MSRPIRVLVVDDHLVVRKGIQALLATEPDIAVVSEAGDGEEAVMEAARLQPDVILMDLQMPGVNGITAIEQIMARQPSTRILVLSSFDGDDKVLPAIRAGALGYVLKAAGPAELVQAIRQVYHGESALHPRIARRVLAELNPAAGRPPLPEPLTEREIVVLRLVAQGESNHEIAVALGISEGTVRVHVSNILSKLHLASRTRAALYALRAGLASLDSADPAT
jgi:NarL family two-component system response regulator LiaR